MLLLQGSIGALNDWADAQADAVSRPAKPIPTGLVPRQTAGAIAAVAAVLGLSLAAFAGPAALAIAAIGLGAGVAYDLRLKRTPWSWAPYAIGIPLLPVFGWVGATGSLPAALGALIPAAAVAGAALAIANALADLEQDREAGVETVATSLGLYRARRAGALLQGIVAIIAFAAMLALGSRAGVVAVAAGIIVVGCGVALGWGSPGWSRQRAWELQGSGLAIMALGWMGALAD